MTDTAATANAACSSSASCCTSECCCPCEGRIKKLEKTVRRIRLWLFISLGVLIFLIGVAIGKGNGRDDGPRGDGRREEIRRVEIMGGPMNGGPMNGGPMMGGGGPGGPGRGEDRGVRRGDDGPKPKKSGKDKG